MAIKDLQRVSLSLKIENGEDDKGNTLYKTKTFSNVSKDATPAAVLAVAQGIALVMQNNVDSYYLNEMSSIESN